VSVLQTDPQLLLTQMFVYITVRSLQCMEVCSSSHVGHFQASILHKINYSCMSKATGCFFPPGDVYVRHPGCVLLVIKRKV